MILLRMLYDIGKSVFTQGHRYCKQQILHFLEIVSQDRLNPFAGYRHIFCSMCMGVQKGTTRFLGENFHKIYSGRCSAKMEKILWETLKLLNERRPHA